MRSIASAMIASLLLMTSALADSSEAQLEGLPAPVRAALSTHGFDTDGLSIIVRKMGERKPLVDLNADVARNPASTMKLITALAALDVLGPDYRWQTNLLGDELDADGEVQDLYFRGGGDPYLVEERLYLLVRALHRRGMRKIRGDLVVDDTLFASPREDTGAFDNQPFRIYNVAPSAVLVNFNSTRFEFRPAPDGRVNVLAYPKLASLDIRNHLRTRQARCSGYRRGISLSLNARNHVRFDGEFPGRCKRYSFTRSVLPSWRYSGEFFVKLWTDLGGEFEGDVRRGETPQDLPSLVSFDSLSLGEAVRLMTKHSSNLIARHLIMTLALNAGELPATESGGVAQVMAWLERHNFDMPEFVLENGAGRSRRARISARHLADLVEFGVQHHYGAEFIAAMPILGLDGTLDDRLEDSAFAGQGHFKTGSLDHVSALAGVYHDQGGEDYVVAVLHNATNAHRGGGEAIQNSLLQWLGSQKLISEPSDARQSP